MRYVSAVCNEKRKDDIYRIYVTDVLSMIAENTARVVGEGGRYTKASLHDILIPKKQDTITENTDVYDKARKLSNKMGLVIENG